MVFPQSCSKMAGYYHLMNPRCTSFGLSGCDFAHFITCIQVEEQSFAVIIQPKIRYACDANKAADVQECSSTSPHPNSLLAKTSRACLVVDIAIARCNATHWKQLVRGCSHSHIASSSRDALVILRDLPPKLAFLADETLYITALILQHGTVEKSGAMQPHTIGVQTGYSCQDHDAGFSARGAGGLEGLWFLIKTQILQL